MDTETREHPLIELLNALTVYSSTSNTEAKEISRQFFSQIPSLALPQMNRIQLIVNSSSSNLDIIREAISENLMASIFSEATHYIRNFVGNFSEFDALLIIYSCIILSASGSIDNDLSSLFFSKLICLDKSVSVFLINFAFIVALESIEANVNFVWTDSLILLLLHHFATCTTLTQEFFPHLLFIFDYITNNNKTNLMSSLFDTISSAASLNSPIFRNNDLNVLLKYIQPTISNLYQNSLTCLSYISKLSSSPDTYQLFSFIPIYFTSKLNEFEEIRNIDYNFEEPQYILPLNHYDKKFKHINPTQEYFNNQFENFWRTHLHPWKKLYFKAIHFPPISNSPFLPKNIISFLNQFREMCEISDQVDIEFFFTGFLPILLKKSEFYLISSACLYIYSFCQKRFNFQSFFDGFLKSYAFFSNMHFFSAQIDPRIEFLRTTFIKMMTKHPNSILHFLSNFRSNPFLLTEFCFRTLNSLHEYKSPECIELLLSSSLQLQDFDYQNYLTLNKSQKDTIKTVRKANFYFLTLVLFQDISLFENENVIFTFLSLLFDIHLYKAALATLFNIISKCTKMSILIKLFTHLSSKLNNYDNDYTYYSNNNENVHLINIGIVYEEILSFISKISIHKPEIFELIPSLYVSILSFSLSYKNVSLSLLDSIFNITINLSNHYIAYSFDDRKIYLLYCIFQKLPYSPQINQMTTNFIKQVIHGSFPQTHSFIQNESFLPFCLAFGHNSLESFSGILSDLLTSCNQNLFNSMKCHDGHVDYILLRMLFGEPFEFIGMHFNNTFSQDYDFINEYFIPLLSLILSSKSSTSIARLLLRLQQCESELTQDIATKLIYTALPNLRCEFDHSILLNSAKPVLSVHNLSYDQLHYGYFIKFDLKLDIQLLLYIPQPFRILSIYDNIRTFSLNLNRLGLYASSSVQNDNETQTTSTIWIEKLEQFEWSSISIKFYADYDKTSGTHLKYSREKIFNIDLSLPELTFDSKSQISIDICNENEQNFYFSKYPIGLFKNFEFYYNTAPSPPEIINIPINPNDVRELNSNINSQLLISTESLFIPQNYSRKHLLTFEKISPNFKVFENPLIHYTPSSISSYFPPQFILLDERFKSEMNSLQKIKYRLLNPSALDALLNLISQIFLIWPEEQEHFLKKKQLKYISLLIMSNNQFLTIKMFKTLVDMLNSIDFPELRNAWWEQLIGNFWIWSHASKDVFSFILDRWIHKFSKSFTHQPVFQNFVESSIAFFSKENIHDHIKSVFMRSISNSTFIHDYLFQSDLTEEERLSFIKKTFDFILTVHYSKIDPLFIQSIFEYLEINVNDPSLLLPILKLLRKFSLSNKDLMQQMTEYVPFLRSLIIHEDTSIVLNSFFLIHDISIKKSAELFSASIRIDPHPRCGEIFDELIKGVTHYPNLFVPLCALAISQTPERRSNLVRTLSTFSIQSLNVAHWWFVLPCFFIYVVKQDEVKPIADFMAKVYLANNPTEDIFHAIVITLERLSGLIGTDSRPAAFWFVNSTILYCNNDQTCSFYGLKQSIYSLLFHLKPDRYLEDFKNAFFTSPFFEEEDPVNFASLCFDGISFLQIPRPSFPRNVKELGNLVLPNSGFLDYKLYSYVLYDEQWPSLVMKVHDFHGDSTACEREINVARFLLKRNVGLNEIEQQEFGALIEKLIKDEYSKYSCLFDKTMSAVNLMIKTIFREASKISEGMETPREMTLCSLEKRFHYIFEPIISVIPFIVNDVDKLNKIIKTRMERDRTICPSYLPIKLKVKQNYKNNIEKRNADPNKNFKQKIECSLIKNGVIKNCILMLSDLEVAIDDGNKVSIMPTSLSRIPHIYPQSKSLYYVTNKRKPYLFSFPKSVNVENLFPLTGIKTIEVLSKEWLDYKITTLDYLMALNIHAGRFFDDPEHYPMLPPLLNDFQNLNEPSTFDCFTNQKNVHSPVPQSSIQTISQNKPVLADLYFSQTVMGELPGWAHSHFEFCYLIQKVLNSSNVSLNIHKYIDYYFGVRCEIPTQLFIRRHRQRKPLKKFDFKNMIQIPIKNAEISALTWIPLHSNEDARYFAILKNGTFLKGNFNIFQISNNNDSNTNDGNSFVQPNSINDIDNINLSGSTITHDLAIQLGPTIITGNRPALNYGNGIISVYNKETQKLYISSERFHVFNMNFPWDPKKISIINRSTILFLKDNGKLFTLDLNSTSVNCIANPISPISLFASSSPYGIIVFFTKENEIVFMSSESHQIVTKSHIPEIIYQILICSKLGLTLAFSEKSVYLFNVDGNLVKTVEAHFPIDCNFWRATNSLGVEYVFFENNDQIGMFESFYPEKVYFFKNETNSKIVSIRFLDDFNTFLCIGANGLISFFNSDI